MATSDLQPRVRAVARVVNRPEGAEAAATLTRRRRPGRIGQVNVVQIMLVEVVLIVVLVVLRRNVWVLGTGVAVALIVLLLALGRSRGRWWSERMLLRWRYKRRGGGTRVVADDRRLAALRDMVPGLTVETVQGPGGAQTGIAADGAGWFAIVEVTSKDDMPGDARPAHR